MLNNTKDKSKLKTKSSWNSVAIQSSFPSTLYCQDPLELKIKSTSLKLHLSSAQRAVQSDCTVFVTLLERSSSYGRAVSSCCPTPISPTWKELILESKPDEGSQGEWYSSKFATLSLIFLIIYFLVVFRLLHYLILSSVFLLLWRLQ
jgi:hypothetical protein